MDSIGTMSGLISSYHLNAGHLVTILLNPNDGHLVSIMVDDGEDIQQYNYDKVVSGVNYGTEKLQWGLFA